MHVKENRHIAIDKLILPADFEERVKSDRVAELWESMRVTGMYNEPLVREENLKVCAGVDRVAAKRFGGQKIVEVKIIECTEVEAEIIEIDENLRRRNHTQEQIDNMRDRRVELEGKLLAEQQEADLAAANANADTPPEPPKRGRGRPAKPEVDTAAKKSGVSKRTIQKARKNVKDKATGKKTVQPPPIATHGFPVKEEQIEAVRELVQLFAEADRHMRNAQSAMTRIDSNKLPFDPGIRQRIREAMATAGHLLRRATPRELCLTCKANPLMLPDCPVCGGSTYNREDQIESAPSELKEWAPDKALVLVDGKFKKYADVTDDDVQF